MNPGGFDYEAWLFQKGIHASGYVRSGAERQKIRTDGPLDVTALRQRIAADISAVLPDSEFAGLVTALAVGDRSAMTPRQWQVLINTGTNHLMAISGLHIGLAAAFGYLLCRRLLPHHLMLLIPAQHIAILCALVAAAVYASLAGFAIPTQRALLMLACVAGAMLCRRTPRPLDVLALALLLVLLWDPAAVMSAGFWFSFLAVAAIFHVVNRADSRSRWLKWGWIQLVIALALLPLSLFMFQQASLLSPLANGFMVPYVSFLVVPLILCALLLMPLWHDAAALLIILADGLFRIIWPLLQYLSDLSFSHWTRAEPGLIATAAATAGIAILLAPRIRYYRAAGMLLVMPLLVSRPQAPEHGAFALHVLDVGQGLAIVVNTAGHTLVYDTGARFSDRLDSGEAVLLPFLIHQGINNIDLLMISHGDGDHIGGAASVLSAFPQTPVLGQGIEQLDADVRRHCRAGQSWHWDGVKFTLLHPDETSYKATNNRSCVLKIEGRGGSALITGDIEQKVENSLLRRYGARLAADILIAPHHGSKTSSSVSFISAVSPQRVIFAAGYRNRYRFPPAEIIARYEKLGVEMYISGHSGTISMLLHPQQGIGAVDSYRDSHGRYWNHRPPKLRQDG